MAWQNLGKNTIFVRKQSGAVEACWAHNPEVRRSKLRSANFFILVELVKKIVLDSKIEKILR